MTITTAPVPVSFNGDGVTVNLPIPWKYFAKSDVVATLRNAAAVETTLVLDTDYTLTAAGVDSGGTLTMTVPPATGEILQAKLDPPNTQESKIQLGGPFPSPTVEAGLDRSAQRDAKIEQLFNRALRVPKTDIQTGTLLDLPIDTIRASKFLGFSSTGVPIAVSESSPAPDVSDRTVTATGGTTSRLLADHFADFVNIKNEGAVLDGIVDDLAAFVSGLSKAAGNMLFVPAGTAQINFTTTTALSPAANTVIQGSGRGITILSFTASDNTFRALFEVSVGNLTFRDLTIKLTAPPSGGTTSFFNNMGSKITLDNVELDGAMTDAAGAVSHTANGLSAQSTGTQTDWNIRHCEIHDMNFPILKTNAQTSAQERITLFDCDFHDNYETDCSFNSPLGSMDDVHLLVCKFHDGKGVNLSSPSQIYIAFASIRNFSVIGCTFNDEALAYIHVEEKCIRGSIIGNQVAMAGASIGIRVLDNNVSGTRFVPEEIIIDDNNVYKTDTAQEVGSRGILLAIDASGANAAKAIVVSNNTVFGFEWGIAADLSLDDGGIVAGNTIDNCAVGIETQPDGDLGFTGNTTQNCTVGISSKAGVFDTHTFIECTTNVDAEAANYPVMLTDPIFKFAPFDGAASSTTNLAMVTMGASDRIYGFVNAYQKADAATADYSYEAVEVHWDGTTFTATQKAFIDPGVTTLTIVDNGPGTLALRVFTSAVRNNIRVQAKLNGSVLVAV